jgi:hypothetical protein
MLGGRTGTPDADNDKAGDSSHGGRLADNFSSFLGREDITRPYAGKISIPLILLEQKNYLTGGI